MKYVTILLSLSAPLTDCCFSDATTAARIQGKAVIPNSSRLSHGVSKIPFSSWTSRRRTRSSGLKCLEQTTELRRLSLRTFRLHEIVFSVVLFLRFRTIIAIKRYGMKCNTFLYVSCVATSPYNAPSWHFYELYSQPFPQKQVNVRNTESPCSRFYVTSGLGPCPVDPRSRTKMAAFWPTLTTHGKSRI